MLKDLSTIGTLLQTTNELLAQVLEELRRTNGTQLQQILEELRAQR